MAKKKLEPLSGGHWHYIGNGTRISGIPRRDLTPEESALFYEAISQVNAHGTVLYAWEPEAPVVIAQAPEPAWESTSTAWEPGGAETKDDAADE